MSTFAVKVRGAVHDLMPNDFLGLRTWANRISDWIELGSRPESRPLLAQHHEQFYALFREAFTQAQLARELALGKDPDEAARELEALLLSNIVLTIHDLWMITDGNEEGFFDERRARTVAKAELLALSWSRRKRRQKRASQLKSSEPPRGKSRTRAEPA